MSTREVEEGFDALPRGANAGLPGRLLPTASYARGLNLDSRGGLLSTRPPFLLFAELAYSGVFQGAGTYSLDGAERIIFAVAGHIYSYNLTTGIITDHGLRHSSTVTRLYFAQIERYFVIQDGTAPRLWEDAAWPVILDGDTIVDQSGMDDHIRFPKGAMMAYGHGRAHVATNYVFNGTAPTENLGRTNILSGDVIKAFRPTDVLQFAETQYLSGGGALKPANELGLITAMNFQQNAQTGTGHGPLVVGCRHGVTAFAVNAPRNQWQTIDLGRVLYQSRPAGSEATYTWAIVNNDLVYRAKDGQRTLRYTVSEVAGQGFNLNNDPISFEMEPYMKLDDFSLHPYMSGVFANNRYYVTNFGNIDTHGEPTFKSLIVMDTAIFSQLGNTSPPVYNGIWTGLDIAHVVAAEYGGRDSVFIFSRNSESGLELYRIDDDPAPMIYDGGTVRTLCRLYTRHYNWQILRKKKQLKFVEVTFTGVIGQVDVKIYYRSDDFCFWRLMDEGTLCADDNGKPRTFPNVRASVDDADPACDPTTNLVVKRGVYFEFCIEWTGRATLAVTFMVAGYDDVQEPNLLCDQDSTCKLLALTDDFIDLNDYEYSVA